MAKRITQLNRAKIKFPPGNPNRTRSKAEEIFAFHVKLSTLPDPVREHRFSEATKRRWRFDFAWPHFKIAVEIEGLIHFGKNPDGSTKTSRHQTSRGYQNDLNKYNQGVLEGWHVLRFSQHQVKTGQAITLVETLFKTHAERLRTAKP